MGDSEKVRIIFTKNELANVKSGSLAYYMAGILINNRAPIRFNLFDINLTPEDIEITGEITSTVMEDGSYWFVFTR